MLQKYDVLVVCIACTEGLPCNGPKHKESFNGLETGQSVEIIVASSRTHGVFAFDLSELERVNGCVRTM